jgi:hypothetical protein
MGTALVATLARPAWWALALASFLVRGGFVLVLLPIVSLPTTAGAATAVAPTLEALVLGRTSIEGVLIGTAAIGLALVGLAAAALAGSWFDLALLREAARDEDVELGWWPGSASVREALALRLTAHLPTLIALGYAIYRIVSVAYEELTAPGDSSVSVVSRVLVRTPDALLLVVVAWLAGEAIGSLAARRAAAGMRPGPALRASARQVASFRGLATLVLTTVVLVGLWAPFLFAAGRTWEHLRAYLLVGTDPVQLAAALLLLSSTWVLGLAISGAALAWRATAWTAELARPVALETTVAAGPPEIASEAAHG